MDPNPKTYPILSYVMSRLPSIGPRFTPPTSSATDSVVDVEQPPPPSPSAATSPVQITDPNLFASMANAVTTVYQTRSILKTLGPRPDHEALDLARSKLSEIDANLKKKLEEMVLSPRPPHVDRLEWRAHLAERERECRVEAEREKREWKAIIDLDELHGVYETMAREAEEKLVKLYEKGEGEAEGNGKCEEGVEVSEDVVWVLEKGVMERVELSGRRLKVLPDAFGSIKGLLYLDVSNNQLGAIPDSIAGLDHLQELNVSSNLLETLPDSIGLLQNLKILNVSGNKLTVLPDSICHCRSLVELDVSFNKLTYLPTNIGFEMSNLQRLCIQYNKIRSLPSSVCDMCSLRHLDAHFNELNGLPLAIGKLTNLEYLNLSSNFSDLKELPETFGELTKLTELDLSNNQIHALPDTFGRLDNLIKLNLDQNPLVVPPMEVLNQGVEAVKEFMAKRWLDILVEEESKSMEEAKVETQTGWLTRSTSWLKSVSSSVSGYIGAGPRSPRDPYLDQQL